MKSVQLLSKSTRQYNEDIAVSGDNYAFILDGATPLKENKIDPNSDAYWYVNTLAEIIKKNIDDSNLKDILKKSINEIKDIILKYGAYEGADLASSCACMIKENNDNYELFVIGDCDIVYDYDEEIKLLERRELKDFDDENIAKMANIAKEKNIDVIDAYPYIKEDLIRVRNLRNKENGYYNLDIEETAIDHGNYLVIAKGHTKNIILTSDGFSSYYDTLKLCNDYKEFYNCVKEKDLDILYNELRDEENIDSNLNKHHRFKVSDDASIIKIEV